MVMNVDEAKKIINEALQEQLAQGGIIHTQFNLERKYMEQYLKNQCDVGGILHNFIMSKPKDHHDGIRGVAKMMMNKGDKLLPDKFDNEVRTGVLFRHWSAEMRQYLNVIDKDMLVLMNIAEKDIESKLEGNSLKSSVKSTSKNRTISTTQIQTRKSSSSQSSTTSTTASKITWSTISSKC